MQRSVAGQLAAAVEAHNATFILGLGDNIYENGIENVDDPQIDSKHKNVRHKRPYSPAPPARQTTLPVSPDSTGRL
jgi:hypothetical protein